MNWQEIKIRLDAIGIKGFESLDHLIEWLKWDCDDKQTEKRINSIIYESNNYLPA